MRKAKAIKSATDLSQRLYDLHMQRKGLKQKLTRTGRLTKNQRLLVLQKTASKCHVCGIELTADKFQADHVESHCRGGLGIADNFLPSCNTCNNYRWHYLPEELHWVLKIGVFAKTQIERETGLGKLLAEAFVKYELKREKIKENGNRK